MRRHCLLLAVGDSLTEGYGLPPAHALPSVLERLFRDEGYDMRSVNLGLSGDTSAGGLRRLRAWLDANAGTLAERQAGTIGMAALVELGANDSFIGIDPQEVEANLDAILTLLQRHGIPALLLGWRAIMAESPDYADEFDALYGNLARRHGVALYPDTLAGVWGHAEMTLHDGVHPSVAGVRHMAGAMQPLVRELLDSLGCTRSATTVTPGAEAP